MAYAEKMGSQLDANDEGWDVLPLRVTKEFTMTIERAAYLMIMLGLAIAPNAARAQRVDNRVGAPQSTFTAPGAASAASNQQPQKPRPYSAPLNDTVAKEKSIGSLQSRIGSNGQVIADAPNPAAQMRPMARSTQPQLWSGLAPAAAAPSTPANPAATPSASASGKPRNANPQLSKERM